MVEKISVQIGLEGGNEVEKKLADIGKAGEQALGQIEKAADTTGIEKLGKASEQAATGIAKIGGEAKGIDATTKSADEAAKAMSGLSLQTAKTSLEITKLAAEITKVGVEIGLAVAKHDGLVTSLVKLGLHVGAARTGLSLLQPVLAGFGITLGATAVAATGVGVAIVGVAAGLVALGAAAGAIAAPYEKLNQILQTLAANTGQSSEQLQRGEALFAQMGVSAETFRGAIAKLAEAMKGLDVAAELKKSADTIVEANRKVLEAEKAVIEQRLAARQVTLIGGVDIGLRSYLGDLGRLMEIQKELNSETDKAKALEDALLEARSKAAEAAANSLSKVLEQVKAIEAGQKGIMFDSLVKGETIAKAVAISLKQAEESGKNAGKVLVDFIANATRAQAIEIGAKFGLTEEQVDRVQRLGGQLGKVDEVWKRIQGAGVLIPPENAAAFDALTASSDRLNAAKERLTQAWNTSVLAGWGATFSSMITSIETGLIDATARVVEFFNTVARSVATGASIVGGFIALGASITWDVIANAGVAAWNALTAAIGTAMGSVGEFIASISNILWESISNAGVAAWDAITGAINSAVKAVKNFLGFKGDAPAATGAQGFARGGMIGGRGSGTSDSNLAWVSRGEYVMPARAVRQPGMLAFLEALRRSSGGIPGFADGGLVGGSAVGVMGGVRKMIISVGQAIGQMTFAVIDPMRGVMSTTDQTMRAFSDSSERLLDVLVQVDGMLSDFIRAAGFARGGMIGGRGSGTSDSNLAWVSRGEHIMPAAIVRQPGVLALLEALRRGGDLRRLLDGMGRFAAGGLVAMPALAGGGTGSMSHVTIQFPGGPTIGGLRASSQVVEELQRAAAMAQVRSGGRKPSRYT